LLGATVAIGVLQALLDLLDRDPIIGAGASDIALGHVDDLLVTGVGGDAALGACHVSISSLRDRGQRPFGRKNRRTFLVSWSAITSMRRLCWRMSVGRLDMP